MKYLASSADGFSRPDVMHLLCYSHIYTFEEQPKTKKKPVSLQKVQYNVKTGCDEDVC